jgi:hypothetical protein
MRGQPVPEQDHLLATEVLAQVGMNSISESSL